jgi:peptide/nickel transport system substrate-binding protein
MRKKFMWLGLSFLLVVVLVLSSLISSCGTKATTAPVTTSTSSTPTVATPVTGGIFTYYTENSNSDPPSWDDITTPGIASTDTWENPYAETLLKGDINKYGPRGNNTFSFQYALTSQFGQYYGPCLATSWEVTSNPLGVVYQLRHGVMWTGNTNIGMAPREFTADDVVYHINRNMTASPLAGLYASYIQSVTATDRYTVTILWSKFFSQWESPIGMDSGVQARIIPEEVVKAGADNWKNQTGTGPFILTNYVSGSAATYTKNPNYWGTTTINGKTYQEPLIDEVVYPIIADQSTAIASLRTGKIDMWPKVPLTYQASLASTSPDMTMQKWLTCRVDMIKFNMIGNSVFNNKDVRRAMYVATDLNTIANNVYQGGDIYGFPIAAGTPEFTPLSQLPAQDQLLYTYDPVKAKQMLSDAGYPNGFACEVTINSSTTTWKDIADTLASEWAKVNVTLTIDQLEDTAYQAAYAGVTYKDSLMLTYSTDDAWAVLQSMRTGSEGASVNDPVYNDMYDKAQATQDDASRVAQKKAMGVYELDNALSIGFTNPYNLNCYWPWVKNYYNEISAGNYSDIMPMVSQMWIDQSMKKTLGY